jgi:outer membrane protein assembly factor BamB
MNSSAKKLIDLMEAKELLSGDVVAELRRQVSESSSRLTAELLAKVLVDNGHLTKFQATKLIAEVNSSIVRSAPKGVEELDLKPESQEAELILEDGLDVLDETGGIELEDDAFGVQTADLSAGEDWASDTRDHSSADASASKARDTKKRSKGKSDSAQDADLPALPVKPVKSTRGKASSENPWDSFRIIGVSLMLALISVAGFFLVRWLLRGSADEAIKRADTAYQQRSYETAATMYGNFAQTWPTHTMASYAKVRQALASLRKDVEGTPNPVVALRTAEAVLPALATEPKLNEQQSDLAGVMVSLAEKFITRIDATDQADQRKTLMDENEKLLAMINDPQLVGSTQRTQLAPTLQRIEESRLRLKREIQRDDELNQTLGELDQLLQDQKVVQAYESRRKLIERYPLLETNPQLNDRIAKASEIQKGLVKDADQRIELIDSSSDAEVARAFVFAEQSGQAASVAEGTLIYANVKGAVYAVDARSGQVKWRKAVGLGLDSHPLRLDDSNNADVLVAESELGRIGRLIGETGKPKWTAQVGQPLLIPQVDADDIVLSTLAGTVACLDSVSGREKWSKQLPQPLRIGPTLGQGAKYIYQTAEHSNLYVLDRQQGNCVQVVYLGHRQATISVPPVQLLGHLFVIENINADAARIRILTTTDEGLVQAQAPISVDGNVHAVPQIDRRQILIQSDLGYTLVLEVDPAAEKDKVVVIGRVPKNLDQPQDFWLAFNKNRIWLAENRMARFDLDVSQSKLVRKWNQFEGDQFVAPLQLIDDTLIHVRRPAGSLGVKMGALTAQEGKLSWETELGSPLVLLAKATDERFDVVNSSGSNFVLASNKPIAQRAEVSLGQGKPGRRFSNPTWLNATTAVMLNQANAAELALYQADGNPRLKSVRVAWGSAKASTDAVAVGNRIVVGLDNGLLVMIDPATGQMIGTPFQVTALKPGIQIVWNRPVYLSGSQTLVAASEGQLVRLAVGDSLRELSKEPLESPLLGPLAQVGDYVVAVQSSAGSEQLVLFDPESLKVVGNHTLTANVIAGPYSAEQGGLVQTDRHLVGLDASGKVSWTIDFPNSQLIGPPVSSAGNWVLANRLGQIWVINSQDGTISGSVDLRQPLATLPLVLPKRILIGSDEGTVLAIAFPTQHTVKGGQQ